MNTSKKNPSVSLTNNTSPLSKKIILAWFLGVAGLVLAALLGEYLEKRGASESLRYSSQAILMAGLVFFGIQLMRIKFDKSQRIHIGFGRFQPSVLKFILGLGLITVPIALTIGIMLIFGWGNVNFNFSGVSLSAIAIGMGTVFLFEALPEELLFRGYIYSQLNTKVKRWKSAVFTICLFAILPVAVHIFQTVIFGLNINFGGNSTITPSFLITLIFFGAFTQYLRILTGSIWTSIGFHLIFVYMNQLIGVESTNLIQFTDLTNETPAQITLIVLLLIVFVVLLAYPRLVKRKLGWNKTTGTA